MKKLVLALLLMLLQLCTACSGTTYHSNEEIGMAFQRHKALLKMLRSRQLVKTAAISTSQMRKGRKRSAAIPAASLWKLTGFTSICSTKCRIRSCGISLKRRLR